MREFFESFLVFFGKSFAFCHVCCGTSGPGSKYCYKSFPSNVRTEEQEEKRRSILAGVSGAHSAKHIPR